MAKKRKRTKAETDARVRRSLGEEVFKRHEETQRILAERIAELDRRIAAKRASESA